MESDRRNVTLLHNSECEDELTKEARMMRRFQHLHDGKLKMASMVAQRSQNHSEQETQAASP